MVICESCQTVNHPSNPACTSCGAPLGLDPALEGDPFIGRAFGNGRFTLDSVVGSGELGMVYRGTDGRTQQAVAVKIVHPDVAETHGAELLRSAGSVARLRHAKIATVLAAARESDGTTFIVTEFVEGETLKSMLGRVGPLGPRRAADILFQLASALAPFHRAGRPHANLKPENVFLAKRDDGSDFVKIVDAGSPDLFGVREIGGGHVIIGNPKYFSPEQVLGEPVGLGSDLFTLGIIGYQLLTGALPFFGATPDQLLDAIVNNIPTPVEKRASGNLPAKLARVIEECLAKRAEDRPGDLRQVATMLASVIKTTQAAPKRARKPFGMPGGGPSTVVANIKALEEDDDDATLARALDADMMAALSDPGLGLDTESAEPPTVVLTQPVEESIPEPLMFTGAFDGGAMREAISAAAAEKEKSIPPPRVSNPPSPVFDSDLQAALAEASADAPAQNAESFDPFASLPIERPSAPPPDPAPLSNRMSGGSPAKTPSPNLANAILDAMDDVRPTQSKAAPAVVAPLATAADFKAIAPSEIAQTKSLEALPPAPPTLNTRWLIVLTCLLLAVGVAAFVYVNYIDEDPVSDTRRGGASAKSVKSATPKSAKSVASASTNAPQSGAPSTGAPASVASANAGSVPSANPASVNPASANPASAAPKSAGTPSVASAPPSAAPKAGPIALTIRSNPGVEVFEGKTSLGKAPVTVDLAPDQQRRLSFRLKGHKSKTWVVKHAKFIERAKDGKATAGIRLKKKALENPYDKKLDNPY